MYLADPDLYTDFGVWQIISWASSDVFQITTKYGGLMQE